MDHCENWSSSDGVFLQWREFVTEKHKFKIMKTLNYGNNLITTTPIAELNLSWRMVIAQMVTRSPPHIAPLQLKLSDLNRHMCSFQQPFCIQQKEAWKCAFQNFFFLAESLCVRSRARELILPFLGIFSHLGSRSQQGFTVPPWGLLTPRGAVPWFQDHTLRTTGVGLSPEDEWGGSHCFPVSMQNLGYLRSTHVKSISRCLTTGSLTRWKF
jgi:hypothetical protein